MVRYPHIHITVLDQKNIFHSVFIVYTYCCLGLFYFGIFYLLRKASFTDKSVRTRHCKCPDLLTFKQIDSVCHLRKGSCVDTVRAAAKHSTHQCLSPTETTDDLLAVNENVIGFFIDSQCSIYRFITAPQKANTVDDANTTFGCP